MAAAHVSKYTFDQCFWINFASCKRGHFVWKRGKEHTLRTFWCSVNIKFSLQSITEMKLFFVHLSIFFFFLFFAWEFVYSTIPHMKCTLTRELKNIHWRQSMINVQHGVLVHHWFQCKVVKRTQKQEQQNLLKKGKEKILWKKRCWVFHGPCFHLPLSLSEWGGWKLSKHTYFPTGKPAMQ